MEAWITIIFGALFLILLGLLHFLKPSLNPSSHMISQYAVGGYGWVMQAAFYCFAISCFSLSYALQSLAISDIATYLLVTLAFSVLGIGLLKTDLIGTKKRSLTSLFHSILSVIAVVLFPIAVTVLHLNLSNISTLSPYANWLLGLLILVWLGFLSFISASLYLQQYKHKVIAPLGYINRFMVSTYALWVIVAGSILTRTS